MARTHGGLFSLNASGSVAHTITFSRWKGRQYVRETVTPHNPRSGLQVGMRAVLKFTSQLWSTLNPTKQNTWSSKAKSMKVSPFNAYVGANQSRARLNQGLTEVDPPVSASAEAAPTGGAAAAEVKSLNVSWTDSVGANDAGTFVYMSTTTGFTPDISNLIAVVPHGLQKLTVSKLITGTPYYFRIAGTDNEGNMGTLAAQFTGTPT